MKNNYILSEKNLKDEINEMKNENLILNNNINKLEEKISDEEIKKLTISNDYENKINEIKNN